MFGTSGIRGVYGKEVTPELAMKVGSAAGAMGKKVVLARDTRATSPILASAFASGAMQTGAQVIDIGIAPTPLLAYASMKEKCCGAMITASHNPPEYNGIKLFWQGMEFTREQEKKIEEAVKAGRKAVEWKAAGQKELKDFSGEYASFLLSMIDAAAIRKRKPRVLVDAGNAGSSRSARRSTAAPSP
jgi:phosphomannomutase/phosphoglucomutase